MIKRIPLGRSAPIAASTAAGDLFFRAATAGIRTTRR